MAKTKSKGQQKLSASHYENILRGLEKELESKVSGGIKAAERLPDAMDFQLALNDANLEVASRTINYQKLVKVRQALERVKDGTYGSCADCEEEIPHVRLNAVPWAERCVGCQEIEDNKPQEEEVAA